MATKIDGIRSDLTILLPSLNEEQTIGLVIDEIRSLPVNSYIIVIDSGTDSTFSVAKEKGVFTVITPPRGKGFAIRRGFDLAITPYIIMLDADYTYPAEYIPIIYEFLKEGADIVVGYRWDKASGSMTLTNTIGNKLLSLMASILYRRKVYDVCSGMWGFRKEALRRFNLRSNGFTLEAELFTKIVKNNYKFIQVPISYRTRLYGSKAKLKVSDGFKIGWFLLEEKWK